MGRRGAARCEARAAVEGDGVKECMIAVEGQASKAKKKVWLKASVVVVGIEVSLRI